MDTLAIITKSLTDRRQINKISELFAYVQTKFPQLNVEVKWNQPMFTHKGTFILAFGVSKKHITIAPEQATLDLFRAEASAKGFTSSAQLLQIRWDQAIDYSLLDALIAYNLKTKEKYKTFWRK